MTFSLPLCHYCEEEIDPRDEGVYRYIECWVQNRKGAGAHGVTRPKDLGKYAHKMCMDLDKRGLFNQPSFF